MLFRSTIDDFKSVIDDSRIVSEWCHNLERHFNNAPNIFIVPATDQPLPSAPGPVAQAPTPALTGWRLVMFLQDPCVDHYSTSGSATTATPAFRHIHTLQAKVKCCPKISHSKNCFRLPGNDVTRVDIRKPPYELLTIIIRMGMSFHESDQVFFLHLF
jgi:hypothetical protein